MNHTSGQAFSGNVPGRHRRIAMFFCSTFELFASEKITRACLSNRTTGTFPYSFDNRVHFEIMHLYSRLHGMPPSYLPDASPFRHTLIYYNIGKISPSKKPFDGYDTFIFCFAHKGKNGLFAPPPVINIKIAMPKNAYLCPNQLF